MVDFPGPITVKICKYTNSISRKIGENTPVTIEITYYLIAEYTTDVPEGLRFLYINGKKFETLRPEKVYYNAQHVYTRVDLKELKGA